MVRVELSNCKFKRLQRSRALHMSITPMTLIKLMKSDRRVKSRVCVTGLERMIMTRCFRLGKLGGLSKTQAAWLSLQWCAKHHLKF